MVIMRSISGSKLYWILFNSLFGFFIVLALTASDVALARGEIEQRSKITPSFYGGVISDAIATSAQNQKSEELDRARLAYQSGRYAKAQMLWQNAYEKAQEQKNTQIQAQILNYLALTNHKLGNNGLAEEYLVRSLTLFPNPSNTQEWQLKAQALNSQGRLKLGTGKAKSALDSWQEAQKAYQQADDEIGALGVKINQAQGWQSLGLYRRAQKTLESVATELEKQTDSSLRITGFRSLGIALQLTGDLEAGQDLLEQSLALSQKLNLPEETSSTLFSLGNNALAKGDRDRAMVYYQQVAATTTQPLLKTEAQLNQLGLLITAEQWDTAQNLLPQIKTQLAESDFIPNRRAVYARVNLAKHSIEIHNHNRDRHLLTAEGGQTQALPLRRGASPLGQGRERLTQTQDLLITTIEQAEQLKDPQSKSYAVGMLGHLYESDRNYNLGRQHTRKALQLAQTINNSELTYQWQWQLGRLLQTQADITGAVASYQGAVNALESLRSDLVVTNANLQFSFREEVEPVYRELVSLLLTPVNKQQVSQKNLLRARNTIESLQLAELNNFFREACLDATPTAIDEIDRQAAVIYPIILRDRLEVIVSLPDKSLKHYSQPISQAELEPVIEELRQTLPIRSRRGFYQPAQKLYSWLIAPALKDLRKYKIETLVFVPDGSFRNIPLATLYDGKQYLIEQYNIALTPGLQLLAPLPLEQVELKTLAAGITQQRRGFSSLEYVDRELLDIQNQTDSFVLRDSKFTKQRLREKIKSAQYPIVHIATHGQFSSNLEDTFLLAWDSNITIAELNNILSNNNLDRQAIELLILSACETARGDERAALGLAGMAVRAGARTTLATLWTVYDESTASIMNRFYQNVTQSTTKSNKAQALRQAQLDLINSPHFKHPYYWSPFIMLGNWL